MKISQSMVIAVLVCVLNLFCGYEIGKRTVVDSLKTPANKRYQFQVVESEFHSINQIAIFDPETGTIALFDNLHKGSGTHTDPSRIYELPQRH